jgi:hypothetical protein
MPESVLIAIIVGISIVGGVGARFYFVKRSEVFGRDGRGLFQYLPECEKRRELCHTAYCGKIDKLEDGQNEIKRDVKKISEVVIRMEERISK